MSQNILEQARASRKGATVIFTYLIAMKEHFTKKVFCCFEGVDYKYYAQRIEMLCGYPQSELVPFHCGGKIEVKRLYSLVEKSPDLREAKILYFIDRDFDQPIQTPYSPSIYETPYYSVENFYTQTLSFSNIIKGEFYYNEIFPEYNLLMNLYSDRQREFHEQITLLNAWIACHRDSYSSESESRLNLEGFNLTKIIKTINLDTVELDYDLDKLHQLFPKADLIPQDKLEEKITAFSVLEKSKIFRGKFEIFFMYSFIEAIFNEFKLQNSRLRKNEGVHMNLSKKNIVSELSQYAETTACLSQYLKAAC